MANPFDQFDSQPQQSGGNPFDKFDSTPGGAATGNPSIQTQGARSLAPNRSGEEVLTEIGGAAGLGAVAGGLGQEIMGSLGAAAKVFPQTRAIAPFLDNAAIALRNAGRVAPAIAGAVSGAVGETAGQFAEKAGAGPTNAEIARIAGGSVGPELKTLAFWAAKKGLGATGITDVMDYLKNRAGNEVKLSDAQKQYLTSQISELRGGDKSNGALTDIGNVLGVEGQRLQGNAGQVMKDTVHDFGNVGGVAGYPAKPTQLADIGTSMRDVITKRNADALTARSEEYAQNQAMRDMLVSRSESAGRYINQLPEYRDIINGIKSELENGKRSPSVQAGYAHILSELTNPEKDVFGQSKPLTFQAIDDVRRKLGDVFRGKPAEGYAAINETTAKDLYSQLSNLQKSYAGGETGPQAKLLESYASSTKGLEPFSSKFGKKSTALDQYRDEQYATDTSSLPATYFKTRDSFNALKELMGNPASVNSAAMDYAEHSVQGMDAKQVKNWMTKNSEWLAETGGTRSAVEKYATRLEDSERAMNNAQDFAKKAAADSTLLVGKSFPAQRAVDLIKSGNPDLWQTVLPAIQQSPRAKMQMVSAVKQVLADQATAKGTSDLFERSIRPALEGSGIASGAEMDFIAQRLKNIQEMKIPEPEKLGMAKRMFLQGSVGWLSSAKSRDAYQSKAWMVPQ